ncbi:MAG: hypothetical protein K2P94_09685 [Rhodospirillaceae bacterium]|nr:hypothetical protein [Rhodospirillaceae bacterium]
MTISADILTLQPIAAPIAPPPSRQPAVSAVGDRDGTANERRGESKEERARPDVTFRAFLNAATFAGLAQSISREAPKNDATEETTRNTPRAAKQPKRDEPVVISGEESESLYRAHTEAARPNARAPEFLAATSRYAKSFFSVSGTFARPGESLELTA